MIIFILLCISLTKSEPIVGKCNENFNACSWSYENTILTIHGNGELKQFYESKQWNQIASSITQIIIEEGITSIEYLAFNKVSLNLKTIEIKGNQIKCEDAFPDIDEEDQKVTIYVTNEYYEKNKNFCEFEIEKRNVRSMKSSNINVINDNEIDGDSSDDSSDDDSSYDDSSDSDDDEPSEELQCATLPTQPEVKYTCKKSLLNNHQPYCNK